MDGLKTKELWGGLSPRELELYLHLLFGSEADTLGQASRELSEILGETYWKNQVYTSLTNLQDKGLVDSQGFTPTKESLDDILDRLKRFYGRTAYDPTIQNVKDLGDDQRYFQVIVNGAEKALKQIGTRRKDLNEIATIIVSEWTIGKLGSATLSNKLSPKQLQRVKSLLETSTTSTIQGMSEQDPIYRSALVKTVLKILSKWVRFMGRYTGVPPI